MKKHYQTSQFHPIAVALFVETELSRKFVPKFYFTLNQIEMIR